jgi:hypothetical protein
MSLTVDPFDILVGLRSHDDVSALEPGSDAAFDALLARALDVSRSPGRARRGNRRKRRMFLGGLIVAVSGTAGTLAWALTRHEHPVDPTTISCNQVAKLYHSQLVVVRTAEDPVETCRRAEASQVPEWGPMPPSIACLLPTGIAGVFPGDEDTCADLGLAVLDTTLSPYEAKVLAMEDAATTEISNHNECLKPEVVADIVQRAIDGTQLDGWKVEIVGDYTEAQPCGGIEFVVADRDAKIWPLPNMWGGT